LSAERTANRRALRHLAAIALAWLVLGEWLVPECIAWLYAVDAAAWWQPLARALGRAQTRHDLAYHVDAWRTDGRWAALAAIAYQALAAATRAARFADRFVPPATPGTLGAIRALVAGVLLASALWEHLPSSALLPREMIHGVGPVLGLLYALPIGFAGFVASEPALGAFQAFTAAALACAALGWRTRWSVPVAAAAYLVMAGILRQYAWFYHTGLIPLYLLIALAFTPCGDGFSLDRWLRVRRGEPVADASAATLRYGWPRYFMWTALALPYVFAGLSKLRRAGLDWPSADNLKSILLVDTLNPMQFDWGVTLRLVDAPDALFWGIGLATLVAEIGYGSVLFSRRARLLLPALTLGMHLGIWLLQNVLFFDLILLQALFTDWRAIRLALAAGRLPSLAELTPAPKAAPADRVAAPRDVGGWPRRLRALAALAITCWALRLEEFPFTAMQMYSQPNLSGVIDWLAVVGETASGERMRAPIERALPAFRDARYRRVIRQAFGRDAEKRALGEAFLAAFLRAHNARAAPAERLVAVEAQRWRWDYRREPDHPTHGVLLERLTVRAE
jgi:hypothetical protein